MNARPAATAASSSVPASNAIQLGPPSAPPASLRLPPSPASLEVSLGASCAVESEPASGCDVPLSVVESVPESTGPVPPPLLLLPQAAARTAVPTTPQRIASRLMFQAP